MQNEQLLIGNFDNTELVNMSQKDDIIEVKNENEWVMLVHDQREVWKNILVKVNNQDIHVMNKRALDRALPEIIEALDAN